MITLYHAANTRSLRVLWLLNELGLEFELKTLPFTPDALNDPAYLKLNPFARVPALVDGHTGLFESGAILEYLLATYGDGRLMPDTDSAQYGVYLQWFHFAEATLMPPLSAIAQHTVIRPEDERIPAVAEDGAKKVAEMLAVIEDTLSDKPYLLGDKFTAADIMMGYSLHLANLFGILPNFPNLTAYWTRLQDRDACKAALATT